MEAWLSGWSRVGPESQASITNNDRESLHNITFRNRLKLQGISGSGVPNSPTQTREAVTTTAAATPLLLTTAPLPTTIDPSNPVQLATSDSVASESSDRSEAPWSKLKKAAISREATDPSSISNTNSTPLSKNGDLQRTLTVEKEQTPLHYRPKQTKLVLTTKTKHYRSIDDLSPEYGGLPFVKKLKILNERQKLEELETVMKTRSFSLDIPDSSQHGSMELLDTLTRSHSEGSTMHQRDKNQLTTPLLPSPLHSSTESNETPERRNLRSILKKLSEETTQQQQQHQQQQCSEVLQQQPSPIMSKKVDSTEFRKLMRAPTVEGYAARHSKLSKSVTFNRHTLQSPPNSATLTSASQNLFSYGNPTAQTESTETREPQPPPPPSGIQIVLPPKKSHNHQVKLIKGSLEDEQQYFADILMAIKQVMSAHLQDMQEKFHQRFEKLEEEVRGRDKIIDQLKAHIVELERNADDSITDSFETVVSRDYHHSWEDTSHEEAEEIQELPQHPLTPLHVWSPLRGQNVVLDIDSTTDTDSEVGDSSAEQTECDSGEFENSSSNWEIELLAAQMRQKRSASLDQNVGRPLRKRFSRGNSAESRND